MLNLQTDRSQLEEVAEPVAPGVARVRPAVFRSFKSTPQETPSPQPPQEGVASRRSFAQRAYQPAPQPKQMPEQQAQAPVAGSARAPAAARIAAAGPDLEKQLVPLRSLSRELVGRGLPAALVTELIAEIVAEYGNQVVESEQDARWALVEQILLRIAGDPLIPASEPFAGSYVIGGPAGSGRSVLIATIALAGVKRGQRDIVLVNTEIDRIGAAAEMDALGKVFNCRVAHAYSMDELREVQRSCSAKTLLLAQASAWAPTNDAELGDSAVTWPLHGAKKVLCVPATAQCDDNVDFLAKARQAAKNPLAVLSRIDETRNVMPAIGALACAHQPVGMVVRGQNLTSSAATPSLATIVRTALGVTLASRKRG